MNHQSHPSSIYGNIVVLLEYLTNGFQDQLIDFLWVLSIILGVFVIMSKNPIVSVLCLIGLFVTISIYLILLGMNFIGLSYLLVYVGAVSILFLFILMLINIRLSELQSPNKNPIPLAIIIGIALNFSFNNVIPSNLINYADSLFNSFVNRMKYMFISEKNKVIYYISSKIWDGNLVSMDHITTLGSVMYTNYSIWLIISSLILLLAMVGTIVITLKSNDTE